MTDLAYTDTGAGPLVVLLHGGALDRHQWDPQVPALARDYRVVAPDARGHGHSPTAGRSFGHEDDVVALLESLGAGPAVIVGLSMGAGTATSVAVLRPDLVDRLVISGAGAVPPDFRDPFLLERLARWERAIARQDADAWVRAFLEIGAGPGRDPAELGPGIVAYASAAAHATIARQAAEAPPPPVFPERIRERLGTLSVPVLAIHGGRDSPDHRRFADEVVTAAGGRVVTLERSGHYPSLEQPADYTAALLDFLRVA